MTATMRVWQVLAVAGLIGLASLLLVPLERLVPLAWPPLAVRALALVQPAVLTIAATALGAALASRVGLGAPLVEAVLSKRSGRAVLARQLPPALLVGAAVALILIAYGALVASRLGGSPIAIKLAAIEIPLVTRLLYGGIVEELLTRWGLMSLFVWAAWRAAGRPAVPSAASYALGITGAALLFSAGHLPLLFTLVAAPPPWLIAAVVAGNFVPGLLFGWLFWRRGIEAAMIAHATAHLLAALAA